VYKAKLLWNGPEYYVALKVMSDWKDWALETDNLELTKDMPNVMHAIDSFEHRNRGETAYYIVLPLYAMGDLFDALDKLSVDKDFDEIQDKFCVVLKWIKQVVSGLREFHNHRISHSDVKTQNIMVNSYDEAVVADLGDIEVFSYERVRKAELKHFALGGVLGTPYYMPPEVKSHVPVSSKDMWALGITIQNDIMHPDSGKSLVIEEVKRLKFRDSVCRRTLEAIPLMTLDYNPKRRVSDKKLLAFINTGLDAETEIAQDFAAIMSKGGMMLKNVKDNHFGTFRSRFAGWSNRDILFVPRLSRTMYQEMYRCTPPLDGFVENAPYIVWKSSKSSSTKLRWTCFAIESVTKKEEDGGRQIVSLKHKDGSGYKLDFSDASCIESALGSECREKMAQNVDWANEMFQLITSWSESDEIVGLNFKSEEPPSLIAAAAKVK